MKMNREQTLKILSGPHDEWNFIIIGGGATGLGVAVDAAARGYRTLLIEGNDFAKGTSGRSTKLVHGGVRYLQKGDIGLVTEALHERGYLRKNAPHLVHDQAFIIGCYRWWEKPFYTVGLIMYDLLAGRMSFGKSRPLSAKETAERIPGIERKGLKGGVLYHDGQFDDARLAVSLAQTAADLGATVINHVKVTSITRSDGRITGVIAHDTLSPAVLELKGRCIINATGVFADEITRMDDPAAKPMVRPSRGVHLVIDRSFLGGNDAIMIPHTSDGRVLFAVPWHDRVILGTTDTPVDEAGDEPVASAEETEFILSNAAKYLSGKPERKDVLFTFAGLRPLAAVSSGEGSQSTKELSRRHKLVVSASGMVTITGGKWTTYRRMAEETVTLAARKAGLPVRQCTTRNLKIPGYTQSGEISGWKHVYGSDLGEIEKLYEENPSFRVKLLPGFDYTAAEVIWAVREEMAVTVEDVLARRLRLLFIDAAASIKAAPAVAGIMASEMGRDEQWEKDQVTGYTLLAKGYITENLQ